MSISPANISFRQLTVFVAVVEHGGFGAAAGPLNMTQSAVSQALLTLERILGGPLLVRGHHARGTGRLQLTALGETTLRHARAVHASVSEIVAAATTCEASDRGRLCVGSIRSVASQILAPALDEMRRRFPQVAVTTWQGTDREVHEWMTAGTVDVGLVGPQLVEIPGARVLPLLEDPWYVALPASHPYARRRHLSLRLLADVPYVMADGGCEPAIRALFNRARVVPRVAHRAQSTDTILAMVAGGLGATLVPELGLESFGSPEIRTVPLHPAESRLVAAVLPAGDDAPPCVARLLQVIQQRTGRTAHRIPHRRRERAKK